MGRPFPCFLLLASTLLPVTPAAAHPAVAAARDLIGVPYLYGGSSPAGFDCSGLVQYVFARSGVPVPRTSRDQIRAAARVAVDAVAPGDVLFFRQRGTLFHVALYVGDGRFIHAPSTGRRVEEVALDGYWRGRLIRVGRFG